MPGEISRAQSAAGVAGSGLYPNVFERALALRAGVDQKPTATTAGPGVESDLTIGVGIKIGGFTFDYAYHTYAGLSDFSTHYFSIGYVGEEKAKVKAEEKVAAPAPLPPVPTTIKATQVFKPIVPQIKTAPRTTVKKK